MFNSCMYSVNIPSYPFIVIHLFNQGDHGIFRGGSLILDCGLDPTIPRAHLILIAT